MQRDVLDHLWETFKKSAFRMETLQKYSVPQEDAAWQAFIEGRPLPPRSVDSSPWLRQVAAHRAAGKSICRVHVIDEPLSPYIQFELLGYQGNRDAGEDIYLVRRDAHPEFATFTTDWWLFDDEVLILMRYNQDGEYLGAEEAPAGTDIDEYRRRRDLALHHAVSLDDYLMSRGRERHGE